MQDHGLTEGIFKHGFQNKGDQHRRQTEAIFVKNKAEDPEYEHYLYVKDAASDPVRTRDAEDRHNR